ncbi:MAG: hypothetical protein LBN27_09305 [Prevotellaceae bacterium]|nr:hypothetical protein [Prevotellaceae bacterium]
MTRNPLKKKGVSCFRRNDRIEKGVAGHTSTSLSNQARNDGKKKGGAFYRELNSLRWLKPTAINVNKAA